MLPFNLTIPYSKTFGVIHSSMKVANFFYVTTIYISTTENLTKLGACMKTTFTWKGKVKTQILGLKLTRKHSHCTTSEYELIYDIYGF